MNPINDDVFGFLEFTSSWVREDQITIFGAPCPVTLSVVGNDAQEAIWDEQRISYRNFRANEEALLNHAVAALFDYYCDLRPSLERQFGRDAAKQAPPLATPSELSKLVKFSMLIFPIVIDEGEESFGIAGDCTWDPEHGIAIKMTNGEIEIGDNDLLM